MIVQLLCDVGISSVFIIGRTHRSNQVNAPEYVFLISELSGEHRFASIVAKRLESLGALTHGDRRATESRDLSKYNIDNKVLRVNRCMEGRGRGRRNRRHR